MKNVLNRPALLLLSVLAAPLAVQAGDRIWITDVTIISPERLDRVEPGNILLENGRIVRVERKTTGKAPVGAKVVSGAGKFLIPGLIDSHVHMASIPGMATGGEAGAQPEMIQAYLRQLPRSYLYYGYTTVVDPVSNRDLADQVNSEPLHPDLYDCGASLPIANGYPMSFIPAPARFYAFPNFIYDPRQAATIPPSFRPADHTAAAAVGRVKKSGAICVKTYYERGFGPNKSLLPVMSRETFAEMRQAATDAQLVLLMHANSFEAQKFAVDGQADVLAHGMWHWGEFNQHKELPIEIRNLLDQIVEKKIGYQSTFQVLEGERVYFDREYLDNAAIRKVIPASMLKWFQSPEGKWFKKAISANDTPDAAMRKELDDGPVRRERLVVAYLASKNANFLLGSDTPSSPTYGNLPGLNAYLEMRQLQKAGLSLPQIFQAATLSNAKQFKLDKQLGTIEAGKIANLVLLKKSPLTSIDAYDSVDTVWIHGKQVAREALAADSPGN